MECHKCGNKSVKIEADYITEYHDAGLKAEGVITEGHFKGKVAKIDGSWYAWNVWVICPQCMTKRQVIEEGCYIDHNGDDDDEIYTDLSRFVEGAHESSH